MDALNLHWPLFLGGVLAAALMSRALMVGVMQTLPNVRAGGLSAKAGQPGKTAIRVGAAIAFGGSLIAVGWAGLAMAFIGVGFAALVARIATAKIDGQTGDVLGATQQITEVACLLALIATL